jgi:hypothetical protein
MCYLQIELGSPNQKTTVVGGIWGKLEGTRNPFSGGKQSMPKVKGPLCLRASVRCDARAPAYERFFRALFQIYYGDSLTSVISSALPLLGLGGRGYQRNIWKVFFEVRGVGGEKRNVFKLGDGAD